MRDRLNWAWYWRLELQCKYWMPMIHLGFRETTQGEEILEDLMEFGNWIKEMKSFWVDFQGINFFVTATIFPFFTRKFYNFISGNFSLHLPIWSESHNCSHLILFSFYCRIKQINILITSRINIQFDHRLKLSTRTTSSSCTSIFNSDSEVTKWPSLLFIDLNITWDWIIVFRISPLQHLFHLRRHKVHSTINIELHLNSQIQSDLSFSLYLTDKLHTRSPKSLHTHLNLQLFFDQFTYKITVKIS